MSKYNDIFQVLASARIKDSLLKVNDESFFSEYVTHLINEFDSFISDNNLFADESFAGFKNMVNRCFNDADLIYRKEKELIKYLSNKPLSINSLATALHKSYSELIENSDVNISLRLFNKKKNDYHWISLKGTYLNTFDPFDYEDSESFFTCYYCTPPYSLILEEIGECIGVIIWCNSAYDKIIAERFSKCIKYFVENTLKHITINGEMSSINKYNKVALHFPRGSDDQLAYNIINEASFITPGWESISFWRTSRNKQSLERVAQRNNPEIKSLYNEHIDDWGLPKYRYSWQNPFDDDKTIEFPSHIFIVPYVNRRSRDAIFVKSRIMKLSGLSLENELVITLRTPLGNVHKFIIYYKKGRISNFKPRKETKIFKTKLKAILERIHIPQNGYAILLSENIGFDKAYNRPKSIIDIHSRISGPFQCFLVLTVNRNRVFRVSKLLNTIRIFNLTSNAFDLISTAKLHLRNLTTFIDNIKSIKDNVSFTSYLEQGIMEIFGTNYFLIFDNNRKKCILNSNNLESFRNVYFNLPKAQEEGVFSINNASDLSMRAVNDISNLIMQNNESELHGLIKSGVIKEANVTFPKPTYDSIGLAALQIDEKHSLIIFHKKIWKLRALEEMTLRLLRSGLSQAITQCESFDVHSNDKYDSKDLFDLVTIDVPFENYLDRVVQYAYTECNALSTAIVIVKDNASFLKFIASRNIDDSKKDTVMSLKDNTLISKCYMENRIIDAHLIDKYILECDDSKTVPFWDVIPMQHNITAFPLVRTQITPPTAVLLVSYKASDIAQCNVYRDIAKRISIITSIWLDRHKGSVIREIREEVQYLITQMKALISDMYLYSNSEFEMEAKHKDRTIRGRSKNHYLPPSLKYIFPSEYRFYLENIFNIVGIKTGVRSITLRIRDKYDTVNEDKLYLLSFYGKGEPDNYLPFEQNINVHSYCLTHYDKTPVVFIPNVNDTDIIQKNYPGLVYQKRRHDTKAELCISLVDSKTSHLDATLNIECNSATKLWLYYDIFLYLSEILKIEVFSQERIFFVSEVNTKDLAIDFSTQSAHDLCRDFSTIKSLLEEPMKQSYFGIKEKETKQNVKQYFDKIIDYSESYERKIHREMSQTGENQNYDIFDITNDVISRVQNRIQKTEGKYNKVTMINGSEEKKYNNSHYNIETYEIFDILFEKLLMEQIITLNRIGEERGQDMSMIVGLNEHRYGWVVNILNDAKLNSKMRSLSEKMFWTAIKDKDRWGKGATGTSLKVLGSMFRSIKVIPNAYSEPDKHTMSLYGNNYGGIMIKLLVRSENDDEQSK